MKQVKNVFPKFIRTGFLIFQCSSIRLFVFLGCVVFLFFSCASSSPYIEIDNSIRSDRYHDAAASLEEKKNNLYGNDEAILYYLDAGMLHYYAGDYHTSVALLQDAERAIEEAYTKSILKLAASVLNNDTSKTYDGEDYEDIYTNAFNALNYYHQGSMEDAVVEIRRMNEKLAFLSDKYRDMAAKIREEADKQDKNKIRAAQEEEKNKKNAVIEAGKLGIVLTEEPPPPAPPDSDGLRASKYANSALGRYL
jgi:hypothetical protein